MRHFKHLKYILTILLAFTSIAAAAEYRIVSVSRDEVTIYRVERKTVITQWRRYGAVWQYFSDPEEAKRVMGRLKLEDKKNELADDADRLHLWKEVTP